MTIKLYKVGGCVRDAIMGVKSKDIDYAVEAPSYEAMKQRILSVGNIYIEHPEYNTIRGRIGKEDVDFVLCRKDGTYSDGRRPDFVEPGTIDDDLARRDFTMNAIAVDEYGTYYDPHQGKRDIATRTIRTVGDPYQRFSEDALRVVRAFRFSITKNMWIEGQTAFAMNNPDILNKLRSVSTERIRDEMHKCFAFSTPETLRLLGCWDKLCHVIFERDIWLMPTMKGAKLF
jgi:tRNA nucleotidyltransferase (CCA-adding enzyme)